LQDLSTSALTKANEANLGEHFALHGFAPFGFPRMAIDLLSMKEDVSTPSNLSITEVKDDATLKTWWHTVSVSFGMSPRYKSDLSKWFDTGLDLKFPMKFYLGCWDGEPVSTSQLFLAGGVAGIYLVTTIPEARRRGIGFAITLRPLQEARKMGYRVGILQASRMGEPVYRRIGFQEFSRINTPSGA
jgi:GNAT superfamily N-acetyltransferase